MKLEGLSQHKEKQVLHEQVGLTDFEKNYPSLSGGMKMRLSLARSLVLDPEYILLDEPLSAVDELTREVLQEELYDMWTRDKFTAVLVTHNIAEAVYLSNRVIVMSPRPGKITHIVDIQERIELRATAKFSSIVNEIRKVKNMEIKDIPAIILLLFLVGNRSTDIHGIYITQHRCSSTNICSRRIL